MLKELNWPNFQSHGMCQAIEVGEVFTTDDQRVVISPAIASYDSVIVDDEFVLKYNPKPGGMIVRTASGEFSYLCPKEFMKSATIFCTSHLAAR